MPTVLVGGVPPTGTSPHLAGSFLAGEQVVGFYPAPALAFGTPLLEVKLGVIVPVTGLGSAQSFGALGFRTPVSVSVGGVPSAQSFVLPHVVPPRQFVAVPGLNHGVLYFHIVGTKLAGEALVGWDGDYLFGRPGIGMQYVIPGVPSAQRFGSPVFGMQYRISGVPSAQEFGVPWIAFDQFQPVPGLGSAQAFGTPFVYRVYLKPPPEYEIILTPVACEELVLSVAACEELVLVPSVPE